MIKNKFMEYNHIQTNKRTYMSPQITQIELDNEISLALESDPPFLPGEEIGKAPDFLKNDPFHTA